MQSSIEKDFHHGISALEDLQKLSSAELSPLIYRVRHHFSEVKRSYEAQEVKILAVPRLHTFFRNFLIKNVKKLKGPRVPKIFFEAETHNLNLKTVDKLLEIFPAVMAGLEKIPFQGEMSVEINENQASFKAEAKVDHTLEQHRVSLYSLTRHLLRENMLLTYKIEEGQLSVILNYSHDEKQVYGLDLTDSLGLVLGVSGIFPMFRGSPQELENVGRHFCVEIKPDLKVEKYYRLPERVLAQDFQGEILHFAFLFRPVSIIIPKEGALYDSHLFGLNGGTGRDNIRSQQDVEKNQDKVHRYIDFFSLLSC